MNELHQFLEDNGNRRDIDESHVRHLLSQPYISYDTSCDMVIAMARRVYRIARRHETRCAVLQWVARIFKMKKDGEETPQLISFLRGVFE